MSHVIPAPHHGDFRAAAGQCRCAASAPYDAVRQSPTRTSSSWPFFQETCEAAAKLGNWQAAERQQGCAGKAQPCAARMKSSTSPV